MTTNTPNQEVSNSAQPMVNFQLESLSIREKSDWNWGLQLAKTIDAYVSGGYSSYFWTRNQQWKENRNLSNGKINMQKFVDQLEFNGKNNYINLNWSAIKLPNRIISGLVGRWMLRSEKIQVTATDSLSVKEKQDEFEHLEFILDNRAKIEALEAESGVEIIPRDKMIPADREELLLWQSQFQRLPEEILYELGCNDVLAACGWFDVLKEKMLHDSAECAFVGTYTWMDEHGVIHVDWVQPENAIYSYSNFPDFRDTAWRGQVKTYKISEIRRKYGREFGGKLTEEQLFEIAATAKEFRTYDNISWMNEWNATYLRPYDEWNVDCIEFELRSPDIDFYTEVTTKQNKSTFLKKGKPERAKPNEKVIEDERWNIYRGVYLRTKQMMLEWGLKKNMIRPQDPKEAGNAEFSYSFYMPQNYDMTSVSVSEKIQEPVEQMILARLRMQQLVMKMRPTGTAINWDAVQNIDYGLGEQNKAIDVKKLYDQTGDIYYRGRDGEGNPIPIPFTELRNSGFLEQLQGLIILYDKHYQIVKDELGEDPNLVSQAAQPRVAVSNVETSQQQAAFATDYYYDAYKNCMADTAKKISCLLKNSVTYGANVYRRIIGEEDVDGRIFSTRVNMLPDAIQIAKFEAILNQAIASTPDLVLFVDPFQLMRIAKEDVKLAEALFRQGQKKMLLHQRDTAMQNQKQIIEGQIKSAQMAEESRQDTEELKGEMEIEKTKTTGEYQNKTAVLSAIMKMYEQGIPIPPELQPLAKAVIENVAIPAVVQNKETIQSVQQQEVAQQQQMAQQSQPMEQPQQQIQSAA